MTLQQTIIRAPRDKEHPPGFLWPRDADEISQRLTAHYLAPDSDPALRLRYAGDVGYVYFLRAKNGLVKIGATCDLIRRLEDHRRKWYGSFEFCPIWVIESIQRSKLEGYFHDYYWKNKRRVRVSGDWFDLTDQDVQEMIKAYPLRWLTGGAL